MKDDPVIVKTAELIKENCSEIVKIYLISYKVDNGGEVTSFKLALILRDDAENLPELECRLYLNVDCELPFDMVITAEANSISLKAKSAPSHGK